MNNSVPRPVPPESWLHEINTLFRSKRIPPSERPFRAIKQWASLHGKTFDLLSHLNGEAWKVIDTFFCRQTKLGCERVRPLSSSVWFYDVSFYEVRLFVILGGTDSISAINPFKCLAKSMPESLLWAFSRDEAKVQEYLEHLSNALDSFTCCDAIRQNLKEPLAKQLLGAAETHLNSAVTGLLDTDPNPQAVGHARLAFETSLKALAGEKAGLSKEEAIGVSHRLDKLFEKWVTRCVHLMSATDLARIANAAKDSASSQCLFPRHDAHYDSATFPRHRMWECYATAQHTFATVLRALGASDSRQLQNAGILTSGVG